MLNGEDAAGIRLDEDAVEKQARAAFFSYSVAPLPLHRAEPDGQPIVLMDHNVREGFHALYSLAKYRDSARARKLAEASIAAIFEYWVPDGEWDGARLSRDFGMTPLAPGYLTFVSRVGRSIGPLVKHYRATGHGPALELALLLKDRALDEAFRADGAYDDTRFGGHCHSTTCVMSSLAQLADLTRDSFLMTRVKAFYDNGLWEIRDEIGWSIEGTKAEEDSGRGEANNTGDILETALILGKWGHTEYFHDAERILRCHLLPSQLRDVSFIVEPPNPDNVDGRKNVADRLRGGFGFPAPYGHEPLGIMQSSKPRVGFNLDIVGGSVGSLCEAYRDVTRMDEAGHWVHMLFDHETESVRVESPYTHSALRVTVKRPAPLFVRVPPWVDAATVTVDGVRGGARVSNGYFFVPEPPVNRPVSFEFALAESEIVLKNPTGEVRARLRGDEVTAMDNLGADLTFFDPID